MIYIFQSLMYGIKIMKNNYEKYTRDQLLQILENKQEEIEYHMSESNFFLQFVTAILIIENLLIIYYYGLKL